MPITQARMESLAIAASRCQDAHANATKFLQELATRPDVPADLRTEIMLRLADIMAPVGVEVIRTIVAELDWIRRSKNRNAYTKEYNRAKRAGEGRTRTLTAPKVLAPKPIIAPELEVERELPILRAQPNRKRASLADLQDDKYEATIERHMQEAMAQGYNPETGLFEVKHLRPDGTEVTIDKTGVVDPDQLAKKGLF